MAKSNAGRPIKVTPEILSKLEEAYAWGCSDGEACFYAGIGKSTLYDYQVKHPEFSERKEALKERPILMARQSVVKGFADDPNLAMKFLEKKKSDEFFTQKNIDHTSKGEPLALNIHFLKEPKE